MIRRAVVAGSFYPGMKESLLRELDRLVVHAEEKKKVLGLVSPHAGYVYSGGCAGKGFGRVELTNRVIILGVNHRGMGSPMAVDGNDYWETPLGQVKIDVGLRDHMLKESRFFVLDSIAGEHEHSLEVQVPFIQYINQEATILPVVISSMKLDDLISAGKELGALFKVERDLMMVASTDMSHYIDAERARHLDMMAIENILSLDPEGLYKSVVENRISMCGMAPTVMSLAAALEAGATGTELVLYTNSGEASGDFSEVVGYASVIIY